MRVQVSSAQASGCPELRRDSTAPTRCEPSAEVVRPEEMSEAQTRGVTLPEDWACKEAILL